MHVSQARSAHEASYLFHQVFLLLVLLVLLREKGTGSARTEQKAPYGGIAVDITEVDMLLDMLRTSLGVSTATG